MSRQRTRVWAGIDARRVDVPRALLRDNPLFTPAQPATPAA
ncbi:hypothetical protein [Amycolatopsis pithecellobii]|nr:hypothetical protein [Amycolatopsis pithecellobii]